MKKVLIGIFLGLVLLNLFFASWYPLHQDIHYPSDIARDFFLLDELDQKKII